MFKTKCNDFLDSISKMRNDAIEKSVQETLQKEHVPYVAELTKTKETLIAEETEKTEQRISSLREELAQKINSFEEKAKVAIQENKKKVENHAREEASKSYDKFILGVSQLVDEAKIN